MGRRGEVIEIVRSRVDLVDLIGSYVHLKQTGQNFSGLCPFHEERTPSFYVSPSRQTWNCFGCGERGGAFDFVMRIERVEFGQALELLASRAGVRIEDYDQDPKDAERRKSKSRLFALNELATHRFRDNLFQPFGRAALDYVQKRGISAESAARFVLGFSVDAWTSLAEEARSRGFSDAEIEAAGLGIAGNRGSGVYDRFRGRLMFPIKDAMGRVIAFGARSLDGSEPKYLNSPETALFSKGRALYGIEELRGHPRADPVLVMEGYTDVIMSAQAGVRGAVATLGTALTPDHAKMLMRYSDRILLVFDGDNAGLKAAEKGAMVLLEAGLLELRTVVLPGGQDPCDWFLARGAAGKEELAQYTKSLLDFLLDRSASRHDISSAAGRRAAAKQLLSAAAAQKDAVTRELVLDAIADRLRLPRTAVGEELAALRRPAPERMRRAPRAPQQDEVEPVAQDLRQRARRDVLEAIMNEPALLRAPIAAALEEEFEARWSEAVSSWRHALDRGVNAPGALLDLLEDGGLRDAARRLLLPEGHGKNLRAQLEGALARIGQIKVDLAIEATKAGDAEVDLAALQALMLRRKGPQRRASPGGEG